MNNNLAFNKKCIFYTGFYSYKNHKNMLNEIQNFKNLEIEPYFFIWECDVKYLQELENVCQNIFIYNFFEYEKNKNLISLDIKNRVINTQDLCRLQPVNVNNLYGAPDRSSLLKLEFFEFWINRMRDQYYLVNKAKQLINNNKYDYFIRSRADITITKFILSNKRGISVPYCNINGNKDHIVQGCKDSMTKYCELYENIEYVYPILNRTFNLHNQSSETMLNYYIEKFGTKLDFHIMKNFIEFENYYINK